MSQQHTTQASGQGMLERVFKLREHGTTARTEVIAGLTTFLTMVYIVFVNPQILGVAGMDTSAVFVTTCLIAAFGSILMGLFANLRHATLRPALIDACPLKDEIARKGIDIMMVRELIGGVYFGKRDRYDTPDRGVECTDLMAYSEMEIERVGRQAFELAMKRRKKVTSVDKANVLETSRLWRSVMHRLAQEYPEVEYEDYLVDNTAMQLVRDPSQFDVVVTENMFGDILSDEASMSTGSLGMLPSASIGAQAPGLYEPIHGSAPDIAGQDKANPIATVLSVAMMFKYSFSLPAEAAAIEAAVDAVLAEGWHTPDIAGSGELVGTKQMSQLICQHI